MTLKLLSPSLITPKIGLKLKTLVPGPLIFASLVLSSLLLSSCGSTPEKSQEATLADIDIQASGQRENSAQASEKRSKSEIRQAYTQYVDGAQKDDYSRKNALTRLAQLELELTNSLIKDSQEDIETSPEYRASLNKTVTLLTTSLRDYPKAKGNDKVLYQLAQTYDRLGEYDKAIDALKRLVDEHPKSLRYPEAQFRIAENAFVYGDYIGAEDAYTEVVLSLDNENFYEKSLFKRGWSRYKQELYIDAADDYVDAIKHHNFAKDEGLDPEQASDDKTQFDEYLRALSLSFAQQRGDGIIRDYFAQIENFDYLYQVYNRVSDLYLQQERYSDAVDVLSQFTRYHASARELPLAELDIIKAWQAGGFFNKLYAAVEGFYQRYQPAASYWKTYQAQFNNPAIEKNVSEQLREYAVMVTSYFHSQYLKKKKDKDFTSAQEWYERYLLHYQPYANKDNIYALYGELLLSAGQNRQAIAYVERAAFDGNLVLDKKSAYSAITLTNSLYKSEKQAEQKQQWLDKHLTFAQRFLELYSADSRAESVALNAAQHAFATKKYDTAIDFSLALPSESSATTLASANNIKARSYLELGRYQDAEAVYQELLSGTKLSRKARSQFNDSLALAIYRQGEAEVNDNPVTALGHFTRIVQIAPKSKLASTGLYDAIALAMTREYWTQAVAYIEQFQANFPKHSLSNDVSKKLSVAYLKSDQKGKAAREFERIAQLEKNKDVRMAALWQAAELYEAKDNTSSAIRAYRDYAHTYTQPYAQNLEAMYKLSALYVKTREPQKRYFWQAKIRRTDKRANKRDKTDRTNFIAASTILDLAQQQHRAFNKHKLVEPLAANLKKKKEAMQESVKLFGLASSYGIENFSTEATFSIGDIYRDFSVALLDSERPSNLNDEELEQYEILLEDQAFPFEEKAIEFYETNIARVKDGTYDQWLEKSFASLQALFPVRYTRKGKLNVYTP